MSQDLTDLAVESGRGSAGKKRLTVIKINEQGVEVEEEVEVDKAALVDTAINIDDYPDDAYYGDTTPAQYEFVIASLTQRYRRLWLYVQMQRNLASSALDAIFMIRAVIHQINPDKYYTNAENQINQGTYQYINTCNYLLCCFCFAFCFFIMGPLHFP